MAACGMAIASLAASGNRARPYSPVLSSGLAGVVLAGTDRERDGERISGAFELGPWEAVVVELFPA